MRIDVSKATSGQKVLGGAIEGRRHLAGFLQLMGDEPAQPQPLYLDFGGIDLATASHMRESIMALNSLIRSRRSKFYLVVANANEKVKEDLAVLTRLAGSVLLSCKLNQREQISDVELIGALDPKQALTFKLVSERGETDARELTATSEEDVQQTAWNNRLAALEALGVIAEISHGKSKKYRPVLKGAKHGK